MEGEGGGRVPDKGTRLTHMKHTHTHTHAHTGADVSQGALVHGSESEGQKLHSQDRRRREEGSIELWR